MPYVLNTDTGMLELKAKPRFKKLPCLHSRCTHKGSRVVRSRLENFVIAMATRDDLYVYCDKHARALKGQLRARYKAQDLHRFERALRMALRDCS